MTFSFAEYLEHMTRDITFRAGDMISAGTCKGTAMDQTPRVQGGGFETDKLFLRVGEVVEGSSPQIGMLRNKIVAKNPPPQPLPTGCGEGSSVFVPALHRSSAGPLDDGPRSSC